MVKEVTIQMNCGSSYTVPMDEVDANRLRKACDDEDNKVMRNLKPFLAENAREKAPDIWIRFIEIGGIIVGTKSNIKIARAGTPFGKPGPLRA